MCVKANHCVTEDHDWARVKVMAVEYVQFSYFCSSGFLVSLRYSHSLSVNYKHFFRLKKKYAVDIFGNTLSSTSYITKTFLVTWLPSTSLPRLPRMSILFLLKQLTMKAAFKMFDRKETITISNIGIFSYIFLLWALWTKYLNTGKWISSFI